MLFNKLHWELILVDTTTYLLTQLVMLLIGITVAVTAVMKFIKNEALESLVKKEKMVMSQDEFQRTLNS